MKQILEYLLGLWARSLLDRLGILGAVATLLLSGYFIFRPRSASEYYTAKVERGDVVQIVSATGTINAMTTVQVGSQVSGNISKLYVDFNSHVKQGQPVAEIDPAIFRAPYTTVQRKIAGITWIQFINASAISLEASQAAVRPITALLRERHRIHPGQDDDFMVRTQSEVADIFGETKRLMTLLLGSVASIALLVGGIGIMNIMLVSVTERTREIGVRMAVGATEQDVQGQFLMEAVALSLVGGAFGIVAGLLGSSLITKLFAWPTLISLKGLIIAATFSIAVGVFFGFYPARKAAQLNPVEALGYE